MTLRLLQLGGGLVSFTDVIRLQLPTPVHRPGYMDAQLHDYGGTRKDFRWRPGTRLSLHARFSASDSELTGTAGFGFWNAPFGDPTIAWPALPQAAWFFFASAPNNLPFSSRGPGRGWFAGTVDAATWRAVRLAPLALPVLIANQLSVLKRRLWPWVRRNLAISYQPLRTELVSWHSYELQWQKQGCIFLIDNQVVHRTEHTPQGPLGFVCWMDNQFLVLTPTGHFRAGTIAPAQPQWMELRALTINTSHR